MARLGCLLLIAVIATFTGTAAADSGEQRYSVWESIRLADTITDKVHQRIDEAVDGIDDDGISERGYLLEGVLANQWIVTRAVMHGFGDINAVIDQLDSDEFRRAAILDILIATYRQTNRQDGGGAVGLGSGGYDKGDLRRYLTTADISAFTGTSAVLEAQAAFIGQLQALQETGFFDGGSVYARARAIAAYLLVIAAMSRFAYMAYSAIVRQPHPPMAWFRVFLKFAIILLLLINLDKLILSGISMSDSVRDMITNSTFGNVESAGDVVGRLLRAKLDYLGIEPAISLKSLMGRTAAGVISHILGWSCYIIAAAVIYVIVLLADIMMTLTAVIAPILLALSLMPSFEHNFGHWFKGYISLLFYGPLAAVYSVMLVAILTISLDTSALAFIIISLSYIIGATAIPTMAKNLSGTVLAGMATGIASLPYRFAAGALTPKSGG